MQTLVQRLIQKEAALHPAARSEGRAALDVCEKLRAPLSTFTGVGGFRSLLGRALVLAKAEVPWLEGLQVKPDGSLQLTAEQTAQLDTPEAARSGTELVAQILGLLTTFIGEPLTLRLIEDVWPKPVAPRLKPHGAKK
ncbi:MAG: hypothetical protein ABI222_10565 [Opitutaceae bacterium]